MRVVLAVTIDKYNKAKRLRPVVGWNDPSLAYTVRFHCRPCDWRGPDISLSTGQVIRRHGEPLNAIGACTHCGHVGTVRILRTTGRPLRARQVTPVLHLEVMGLQLDQEYVDFNFQWTMLGKVNNKDVWLQPFTLTDGSYIMGIGGEEQTGRYGPAVMDVEGRLYSASVPPSCQCL